MHISFSVICEFLAVFGSFFGQISDLHSSSLRCATVCGSQSLSSREGWLNNSLRLPKSGKKNHKKREIYHEKSIILWKLRQVLWTLFRWFLLESSGSVAWYDAPSLTWLKHGRKIINKISSSLSMPWNRNVRHSSILKAGGDARGGVTHVVEGGSGQLCTVL